MQGRPREREREAPGSPWGGRGGAGRGGRQARRECGLWGGGGEGRGPVWVLLVVSYLALLWVPEDLYSASLFGSLSSLVLSLRAGGRRGGVGGAGGRRPPPSHRLGGWRSEGGRGWEAPTYIPTRTPFSRPPPAPAPPPAGPHVHARGGAGRGWQGRHGPPLCVAVLPRRRGDADVTAMTRTRGSG